MEMYGERKAFPFPQVGVIKYAPLFYLTSDWRTEHQLENNWWAESFSVLLVFFFFPSPEEDCSILELDDNRRHQANAAESIIS